MLRIYFLFLFTFCCIAAALAETFVVTSNADAGPGTLREVLTKAAANGSTEKDYINFNLPDVSEAGRTITLQSKLPNITSNTVIDGTSQPGIFSAVVFAKINLIIGFYSNTNNMYCLQMDRQSFIEIYGLCLDGTTNYTDPGYNLIYGIYATSCKDVTIGAPGKGNVIKNFTYGISLNSDYLYLDTDKYVSVNIKISSNVMGYDKYGLPINNPCAIYLRDIKSPVIGGSTKAEGNICHGQISVTEDNRSRPYIPMGRVTIQNNQVGLNFNGTQPLEDGITYQNIIVFAFYYEHVDMINNVLLTQASINSSGLIAIKGNSFGTDITGTKNFPTKWTQLVLGYCSGEIVIGGPNIEDGNIFTGAFGKNSEKDEVFGVVSNIGSYKVSLLNNTFRCNNSSYDYYIAYKDESKLYVTLDKRTSTSIEGTATPNSKVDLYYGIDCGNCEAQQFFGSVIADATGNWVYSNSFLNYSITACTTIENNTSEFTRLKFINQSSDLKVSQSCNGKGGAIKGLDFKNALNYAWYNSVNVLVSNQKELINQPPGKYYLKIDNGYCSLQSAVFEITDAANQINDNGLKITQASCNHTDGSITGLQANFGSILTWTDQSNKIIGNGINLLNVPAGKYYLTAQNPAKTCSQVYGPVNILNTTGPNIDETGVSIQTTPCNQTTGSITNLTITGGTGRLNYSWKNAQNQIVATTKDLQNQPAGKYTLQVNDDSACGPVYSSAFEILETNGITINVSGVNQTNTTCNNNNGSITGITVQGGNTYEWRNSNNQLVGTALNLNNVGPGKYHLVVSNASCNKESPEYIIVKQQSNNAYTSTKVIKAAYCNLNNGSIQVIFDTQQPKALRWENNAGVTIGQNALLQNLDAGSYQLYVTDDNGCESALQAYTVTRIAPMSITLNTEIKTDDQCSQKLGSIKNVNITGGQQPYIYKWLNSAGTIIATSANLTNVAEGTYTLEVTDATGCDLVSQSYTIENQTSFITAPSVASNIQLCGPGQATINIANPGTGYIYRVYDTKTGNKVVAEQSSNRITISVKKSQSLYVSRLLGNCESQLTEVLVAVGVSGTTIPNTITPNGDGVNDLWEIKGIENYPASQVQLFNRYGQKVFESRGYSYPFDGTRNGQRLSNGTYYYIINLGSGCSLLSGNLTIIR